MSLFNPWVILGIVMAILSSFGGGYFKGEHDEHTRHQVEIAALNAKARETEQAMAQVAQSYGQTLRKANNAAKVKEDKLRADIASGERRLFIPVKAPECAISAASDTATASGDHIGETRAELSRSVADDLIRSASDGDTAIRKLNACIQTYETMRTTK
jgi:prophage endopeptidase